MTINSAHRYLEGIWDWAILDGCFGQSRVRPTDVDGYIERNGHKLFIETKAPGVALPDNGGQMIALKSLVDDGHSLLILWGTPGRPNKLRLMAGACDRTEEDIDLGRVRQLVSAWYAWADRTPYRRPAATVTHRTVEQTEIQETDSMSSYQQITLLGNLGNDPEMRYTASGTAVTSFSLAVSRQWTDASGEKKEKVTWFRVSVWGNQAEPCSTYLHKGSKVLVVGEVEEARVYTDKDGNARASLEVKAATVQFLDSRKDDDAAPTHRPARRTPTKAAAATATVQGEDIPF